MQNTGKRCMILLVFIILRWSFNYESNVFQYNKILIDCVFGNSKFVVPLISASPPSIVSLGDNKLAIPSYPVIYYSSSFGLGVRVMIFNSTFNYISVISWQSVLLVEETRIHLENHWPVASHWQNVTHIVVSSTPPLNGIQTHTVSVDREL